MRAAAEPSRPRRSLIPVASAPSADGFIQQSGAPVLRDDWPDGFDYACGHCGQVVLVSCVAEDQLWDLAFQCFGCKGVSTTPALPPEMALPWGHVLTLPGLNQVSGPIDLRGRVMVGRAPIERERENCGPQGATFGSLAKRPPRTGDAKLLEELVSDFRRLLGDDFDRLEATDKRARESPTPSEQRNPLMVAVHAVQVDIATFATSTPTVDDQRLMELLTLRDTLERWKRHPFYRKLVEALVNEYQHTVIMLAAVTALVDCGNGVMFQESVSHKRTPDALVVLGAHGQRASVEVKVPPDLAAPKGTLGYDALLKVVKKPVKRARGQLSRERPGLLVIGGFHLQAPDANDLVRAATDYLHDATRRGKHPQLMGILLVLFVSGFKRSATKVDVGAALDIRVVRHPGYRGDVGLRDGRVS